MRKADLGSCFIRLCILVVGKDALPMRIKRAESDVVGITFLLYRRPVINRFMLKELSLESLCSQSVESQ